MQIIGKKKLLNKIGFLLVLSILILGLMMVVYYYQFLFAFISVSTSTDDSKTTISNTDFDFEAVIDSKCHLDHQWANYLVVEKWMAWLSCPDELLRIRLIIEEKSSAGFNLSDENQLLVVIESDRLSYMINDEKKISMIAITHPLNNTDFIIIGRGNEHRFIKEMVENIIVN